MGIKTCSNIDTKSAPVLNLRNINKHEFMLTHQYIITFLGYYLNPSSVFN